MRFLIAPPLVIVGCLIIIAAVVNSIEDVGTSPAATDTSQVCSADNDGSCVQSPEDDTTPLPTCFDLDDDNKCNDYATNENACINNPGYMAYKCAATCNTCAGPSVENSIVSAFVTTTSATTNGSSEQCSDDNYQCLEWAGMGECDANPNYMLKSCRYSCMTCFQGTVQFGIAQRVPMTTDNERVLTETRLTTSIEYIQRIWKDGDVSKNVRYKCKNVHEDCTFWAALGECEKNPTYMNLNCAPACYTCDKLDMRHRCPIEPDNPSIWVAGDLNTMMERIVDDTDNNGEFARYNPKALSRPMLKRDGTTVTGIEKDGPWVVVLENFVSHEEADRLVELGKQQGYDRSADVGKEKPDGTHESKVSDSRTSHNTWCKEGCHDDPLVSPVIARIANITRTESKNSEYLQLLQYEPGQYYKQHHDYIGHHKEKPCGVRILTLFIYLNDVDEDAGGGTRFSLLNITVQPKKGSAVLWPSVLDGAPEDKDGRTDHEALPVLKGLKYGANAWIHNRDYKKAYTMGCQ